MTPLPSASGERNERVGGGDLDTPALSNTKPIYPFVSVWMMPVLTRI